MNCRYAKQAVSLLTLVTLLIGATGCFSSPSEEQLKAFMDAAPPKKKVKRKDLKLATKPNSAYRLVAGDLLDVYMPSVLATVQEELALDDRGSSYLARVSSKGQIAMPLLGWVDARGKTVQELEEELAALYYPKHLVQPPTIVATIQSYYTVPVSILGAVGGPGTYELRERDMSLVSLISNAGGMRDGASMIRIRARADDPEKRTTLIPVEGPDVDFPDLALQAGDVVEVEAAPRHNIYVTGLVVNPTTVPYSPRRPVNLKQAVAIAGGLDTIADPQWVTVYRTSTVDGKIYAANFRIKGEGALGDGGASLLAKPGDVIAVEHDLYTQARVLGAQIIRIGVGGNLQLF